MTRPVATRPPGADSQYCERCGDVAGEATSLRRVGLTRCSSCNVHACQRCWAKAAGACPGCGFSPVGASIVAAFRSGRDTPSRPQAGGSPASSGAAARPGTAPRRTDRSAALAVLVTIVALSVVGFVLAGPLRPTGGVEGVAGTPGPVAVRSSGPSAASKPPAVVAGGQGATPTPKPQPRPTARPTARPDPVAAPTPRPNRTPGATPAPTPAPTPRSTPRPTPRPTAAPTPTPTPSPCVAVAPQLVGQKKSNAARLWRDAGFTGDVTTLAGHGNYRIATQNRTAGNTYGCNASVTVGP